MKKVKEHSSCFLAFFLLIFLNCFAISAFCVSSLAMSWGRYALPGKIVIPNLVRFVGWSDFDTAGSTLDNERQVDVSLYEDMAISKSVICNEKRVLKETVFSCRLFKALYIALYINNQNLHILFW